MLKRLQIKELFFFLLIGALVGSSLSAYSQEWKPFTKEQMNIIMPSSTRFISSLHGTWERAYDGETWEQVSLPYSDVEKKKVWYRSQFRLDKNIVGQFVWHLYFLGSNSEVEVYINKQFVKKIFGGLAPFDVRIPDKMLANGMNTVELIVSPPTQFNQRHLFSEETYTGTIREVMLVGCPLIWTNDVRLQTLLSRNGGDGGSCQLRVQVSTASGNVTKSTLVTRTDSAGVPINVSTAQVDVTLIAPDQGQSIIASASKPVKIESDRMIDNEFQITVNNPRLWTIENPYLYELQVKISIEGAVVDEYTVPVGIRDIRIGKLSDGSMALSLNGQYLHVKGVEYIENWGTSGKTASSADIERDIRLMKTLGANVIRVRSAPPHPYFVEMCNRNGLLLMIDLPAYDVPNNFLESEEVIERMRNLAERISISYDRMPSVMAWGVGDGFDEHDEAVKSFQEIMMKTFRMHSSKMIYKTVRFGSQQIAADGLDFICFRTDNRWKPGDELRKELQRMKSLIKEQPFLVCFGKLLQPENRNGHSDPLSAASQAKYLRDVYRVVEQEKGGGVIVFTFNDYRCSSPVLMTNAEDKYIVTSGLVDSYRLKRLSYEMVKALFNDEREPLLSAGLYKEDTPMIFIVTGLVIGLVLLLLMSRFRRFREYFIRALLRPYNFYADIRDQRILSNFQTIILGLTCAATAGSMIASTLFYHRFSYGSEFLLMMVTWNDLKFILDEFAWSPGLALTICTLFIFFIFSLIAALIRIAAMFVRGRLYFSDAFTITVWAVLPLVLLLPLSMIMYKIFTLTDSMTIMIMMLVGMILWCGYRLMRATSVVFDIRALWVYSVGIVVSAFLVSGVIFIYNYQTSIISYIRYYLSVWA